LWRQDHLCTGATRNVQRRPGCRGHQRLLHRPRHMCVPARAPEPGQRALPRAL